MPTPGQPIRCEVTRFPLEDDPGWYETDIWDCSNPECGPKKMVPEVEECLLCGTPQPEGAVYRGRCWGMRIQSDPSLSFGPPRRPLIKG